MWGEMIGSNLRLTPDFFILQLGGGSKYALVSSLLGEDNCRVLKGGV